MPTNPRVFISYSHDSDEHAAKVLALADSLLELGVDAVIDQYTPVPPEGWPRWMEDNLDAAQFVLMVCTETYLRRVMDREKPGTGRGVLWEANLIYNELYAHGPLGDRFIPISFEDAWQNFIPKPIQGHTRYTLKAFELSDPQFEALCRHITGQPATPKPDVGSIVALPAKPRLPAIKPAPATDLPPSGALSRIWNVPHRRNPNFAGRDDLLEKLRTELLSGKPAAETQAVTGLGGVGKTQLAAEYCYRHAGAYDLVWWLRAEQAATLVTDFADLGVELGIVNAEYNDLAAVIAIVRKHLERATGWLLVFDNANNPDEIVAYLPQSTTGHTLITSRYRDWGEICNSFDVPTFPEEVGAEFLLTRTGSVDKTAAKAISRFVGGLALALEHAGAYVSRSRCSLTDYLKDLNDHGVSAFRKAKTPQSYHDTILTTWTLAIEEAGKTHGAQELLEACAYLAPDDIPRDLLEQYATSAQFDLDDAIGALRDYSLVEATDCAVSVHRLVQAVQRDAMDTNEAKVTCAAVLARVRGAYPYDVDVDYRTWPLCGKLNAHVVAVTDHTEKLGLDSVDLAYLLNQWAIYRQALGDYAGAKVALERALRIAEAVQGPDHPSFTTCLSNLGVVLRNLGDYIGAKVAQERALRIDEAVHGADHPRVAIDLNNLGAVLRDLGDYTGAKVKLERALRIDEAVYGPDHPFVAIRLCNVGNVLRDFSDYSGAKVALERALRIDEAVYGPDHPSVAIRLGNLGNMLYELGDCSAAKVALERALAIFVWTLAADHPHIAAARQSLAVVDAALAKQGASPA